MNNGSKINAVGIWFYSADTKRHLYLMRNDKKYKGHWGLPGGKVEEGEEIPIYSPKFGSVKDYEQEMYAMGFRITHKMKKFNKVGLMEKLTKSMKRAMIELKDVEIFKFHLPAPYCPFFFIPLPQIEEVGSHSFSILFNNYLIFYSM